MGVGYLVQVPEGGGRTDLSEAQGCKLPFGRPGEAWGAERSEEPSSAAHGGARSGTSYQGPQPSEPLVRTCMLGGVRGERRRPVTAPCPDCPADQVKTAMPPLRRLL